MAKRVKCSFCGNLKWMENKYFKLNLTIFKAENSTQFNSLYLCRDCRRVEKSRKLKNIPEFIRVKNLLQEAIDEYIKRGWNNRESEIMCKNTVEAILADQHISPQHYKVVRNEYKIKGILLWNIPFWHNVLIELDWKENR